LREGGREGLKVRKHDLDSAERGVKEWL